MAQTTFTDNVLVDGSQDTTQLRVQGHTTQNQPLQTWENSAGTSLARVSGDGNVQVGDDLLGWSTPDALIESHRAETSTSKPQRGFHSLGRISGTLNALVQWIVGELELRGSSAIDALHTALRIRASNVNTGTPTANAELRGADIEVINDASAGAAALTKATGLQVGVTNASGKTITEAVGVRVKMNNAGVITNPYGIYVEGVGVVHFEDYLEMKRPASVPGTPATDFLRVYGKSDGKLYAKNWSGQEFDLTGSGTDLDGPVVINESGADADVRIESNNDANNLFSDGGNDNVGIGTGTPDANTKLHVVSTSKTAIPRPVMSAAQLAAITGVEGARAYASDTDMEHVYDGQRYRNIAAMGWQPYAIHEGIGDISTNGNITLAANGGSIAIPIRLSGHMLLESVSVRNVNASIARTWGWDLYAQYLNNGNSGENTLARVAASNGDETFTPTAISTRTLAAASSPVYLGPGLYWLVVQSTHATSSFLLAGRLKDTTVYPNINTAQTKTTTNPNGATLDFVAATWTKQTAVYGVSLNGRVFGQTAQF